MVKDVPAGPAARDFVRGRTVREQLAHVRTHGTHALPITLREQALHAIGVDMDKKGVDNAIHFGCYLPFRMAQQVRSYLTILDRLGIEYSVLEKEYCCGAPWLEHAVGDERQLGEAAAAEFMTANVSAARERGATKIVYLCQWCAAIGARYVEDAEVRQLYYPDLVIDKLRQRRLRVAPAVIGYYEGCHARVNRIARGVTMDWTPYREILDSVEGLRVIDIDAPCCRVSAEKVVAKASDLNLGTIVSPCPACHGRIGDAGRGQVRMEFYSDLLLSALA